jgi:hypothetical protein
MRISKTKAANIFPAIGLRDASLFVPNDLTCRPRPSYYSWISGTAATTADVMVFTDDVLADVETSRAHHRVAWLMEPPAIKPSTYEYIRNGFPLFDLVFTFDESLCRLDERFRFFAHGTTWISELSRQLYAKTKNLSIIASPKAIVAGHRLRHEVVDRYGDRMDVFGRAYRNVADKTDALADYRYSIAIENSRFDTYFTEKIIDCFLTGTVPIYWGTEKIVEFFDAGGIISFPSVDDLDAVIASLTEEDYLRRLPSIRRNFETAGKFICLEDQLWERGLKELFSPDTKGSNL